MSEDNPPIPLRAGPLTLAFDRGELRWIRLGDREVLHGVYAAVRTPEWATVPAVLEDLLVSHEPLGRFAREDERQRPPHPLTVQLVPAMSLLRIGT